MNNNTNPEPLQTSQLCVKCCSFFANPQFGRYCSKCFKDQNPNPKPQTPTETPLPDPSPKAPLPEPQSTTNQTDHSFCRVCSKKTGILAYKCKCEYTFCKRHRMPESHSCEFDFVQEGREMLAKANPGIQRTKIERV